MENDVISTDTSSSGASRREKDKEKEKEKEKEKDILTFHTVSDARYEVDVKILSAEEKARVKEAELTGDYFEKLSPGLSKKLQDYLTSDQCASAEAVRKLANASVHFLSEHEYYVSFKAPMCNEEFAGGKIFNDLRTLGESLIKRGFPTIGFSYLAAACQLVAAFPQKFANRYAYDTAKQAALWAMEEAYAGLRFSRKRLPAPVADSFKNVAARLDIKEHDFLRFLGEERDEAADFEWALKSLGLPPSDASSIARNASYEVAMAWLALLDVPEVHLPKQTCEKFALFASRKTAVSTLITGPNDILRSIWIAVPEAGLFMACLLRDLAERSDIDRPSTFYDCLIECIDWRTPAGCSDFCKACIPKFKNRIGKERAQRLLALPSPKSTTTTSASKTTSTLTSTSSSTTTTKSTPKQKPNGGKQS